ncbi:UNVERIFIED_CONTAM: hypothetical protein Scaly_0436100 [Sesamum calycinum]|uniref:Uncharacterized protein n=1 Tax=Sesamum calycinum TaxID=2727403 RepID=A0AAW2SE79_9LAMI
MDALPPVKPQQFDVMDQSLRDADPAPLPQETVGAGVGAGAGAGEQTNKAKTLKDAVKPKHKRKKKNSSSTALERQGCLAAEYGNEVWVLWNSCLQMKFHGIRNAEELADMVSNISVDHPSKLYSISNISDGDLVHCYSDTECEA